MIIQIFSTPYLKLLVLTTTLYFTFALIELLSLAIIQNYADIIAADVNGASNEHAIIGFNITARITSYFKLDYLSPW